MSQRTVSLDFCFGIGMANTWPIEAANTSRQRVHALRRGLVWPASCHISKFMAAFLLRSKSNGSVTANIKHPEQNPVLQYMCDPACRPIFMSFATPFVNLDVASHPLQVVNVQMPSGFPFPSGFSSGFSFSHPDFHF